MENAYAHRLRIMTLVVMVAVGLGVCFPRGGSADPGDLRKTIVLPPAPNNRNVSVAIDCEGYLYYTNRSVDTLYKIDQDGILQYKVRTTDQQSGVPVYLNCLDWDESNQVMWAAGVYNPGSICAGPTVFMLTNPPDGIATKKFAIDPPG